MRATMLSALLAAGLLPQGPAAAETARVHPAQVQTTRPVTPGQPLPKLVIGAPGRCEMTVNKDPRTCSSGLVYVQHQSGSILLSVQSGPDVTIGFQADRDEQPKPEEYILYLSRMHTSVSGRSAAKEVTGTCRIAMSTDGQTWHRATCTATDRSGLVTVVNYVGNGQPVTAARPGQDAPAAAVPAPGTTPPPKR